MLWSFIAAIFNVVLLKAFIPTYSLLSSSNLHSASSCIPFSVRKEISNSSILCIRYFVKVRNSLP